MKFQSLDEWYKQKCIFITGGTGYMGKVLIEKILRSLPQIDKIYVLIKSKRGQTPQERIKSLGEIEVFRRIMEENPTIMEKIIPITGDISEENLGISQTDRLQLINDVSIVFHLAATLRLEANLKDAIQCNAEGTLSLLQLCKQFKKLEVFVHVSTIFCCWDISILKEKVYIAPENPYDMIEFCKTASIDEINAKASRFFKICPNSYIFSKRLAETIVNDMRNDLPIVIARPSIVLPSLYEPFPGWVDSLNGPMGIIVAAGKGVLRTMFLDEDTYVKGIPVDIAINSFLNMAYKKANGSSDTLVYNLTTDKIITYKQIIDTGRNIIFKYPFEWTIWYPGGNPTKNRFLHNLTIVLFHYLPAYFIDFFLLLFMQKRLMVRVQNKITFGLHLLEYFTKQDWLFINYNCLNLEEGLSKDEKRRFPVASCLNLDVEKYLENCLYGSRVYCLKESPKTLPFCRIYIRFLFCLNLVVKGLFYYYMLKLIISSATFLFNLFIHN